MPDVARATCGDCDEKIVGATAINLRRFEHAVFYFRLDVMIARTSYSGEYGFEIFVKSQHAIHIWNYLVSNGRAC